MDDLPRRIELRSLLCDLPFREIIKYDYYFEDKVHLSIDTVGDTYRKMALLKDERIVITAQNNTVEVWNLKTSTCDLTLTDYITTLIVLEDQRIVSGSADGSVKVWTSICEYSVESIISLPNDCILIGTLLNENTYDNILLWDLRTQECYLKLSGYVDNMKSVLVMGRKMIFYSLKQSM